METEEDATYPFEHITREKVDEVLKSFVGRIEQIPPTYSACKVDGKRAFALARQGEEVDLKPKVLVIDEIEVMHFGMVENRVEELEDERSSEDPRDNRIKYQTGNLGESHLSLTIRVVCSKGTYIRALARDIGIALESGAHLISLRRTRVGNVRVEDCMKVENFPAWLDKQDIVQNAIA
jgi:tRNA pseudouridine55 synthase